MSIKACSGCGSENDATRVYCTECGAKLPDDLSPSKATAPSVAAAGKTAPPLPRLTPARRHSKPAPTSQPTLAGVLAKQIVLSAVMGAMLAAIIQMARTPDALPAAVEKNPDAANQTFRIMKEVSMSPAPSSWTINTNAINQYLATTIEPAAADASSSLRVEFVRAFVNPGTDSAEFCIEQRYLGLDLFFRVGFVPEKALHGTAARITGFSIGRLPVHPALAPLILPVFRPVLTLLEPATTVLQKAATVTISPADTVIQWPGSSGR